MALKGRVLGAGKLLVLAGALVATFLLFAAASMRLALRSREVQVPSLINRPLGEATTLAADRGLGVRVEEPRRLDPQVPTGYVITQEPPAGTIARRQRSVRVWVSAGARTATVPGVTGETERAAQLRLAQDGLEVGSTSEIRSAGYPYDSVIAQDPPADMPGSRVTLLVNRSEPDALYVMPDLIGAGAARISELLRARGFRVAVVGSIPYPGVAAGIVLRQRPRAGFQIAPGDAISLEVSQ